MLALIALPKDFIWEPWTKSVLTVGAPVIVPQNPLVLVRAKSASPPGSRNLTKTAVPGDGLGETDGETDDEGDTEGEFDDEGETEGDTDGLLEGETELDGDREGELEGLTELEGDLEAEGESEAEGEREGLLDEEAVPIKYLGIG